MANKTNYWLWGTLGVLAFSFISFFSTKNRLITLDDANRSSWTHVENQLQRRYDLISDLTNTLKEMSLSDETLIKTLSIAKLQFTKATATSEKIIASAQIEATLARLRLVIENDPKIINKQHTNQLLSSVSESEDRILIESMRYNENIKIYNQTLNGFPTRYIAKFLKHTHKEPFNFKGSATTPHSIELGK